MQNLLGIFLNVIFGLDSDGIALLQLMLSGTQGHFFDRKVHRFGRTTAPGLDVSGDRRANDFSID
jgi:hypothetical protein